MSMHGIPIVEDPRLPDDQMFMTSDGSLTGGAAMVLIVGTQPPDLIKQAGRDGRLAVRRGLADVLAWLGEPVVTEPLMVAIRGLAERGERGLPPWFRTTTEPGVGR